MTSLILAWLTGEGIMIYRQVTKQKRPPLPAELIATSGLFILLALLAESHGPLAQTLAWGLVGAAALNLLSMK
jgi:hypothetical protein